MSENNVEEPRLPVDAVTIQPSTSGLEATHDRQVLKTKKRTRTQVELEDTHNTGFDRVLTYFKEKQEKKHSMNATEHTFMGWAKTVDKLSKRRKVLFKWK